MAYPLQPLCICLCILVLLPVACCARVSKASKATYYGAKGTTGAPLACGYGKFGLEANDGRVCGVSDRLYNNGSACGSCYLLKCAPKKYCNNEGVTVVVTDNARGKDADFVLTHLAFANMALPEMTEELLVRGSIEVRYQKVACNYPGFNLKIQIHAKSRYPDYLAIVFLYKGGESDIVAVEVFDDSSKTWKQMLREHGAIWSISNPPKGTFIIRVQISGNAGLKWVELNKTAIPKIWKAGIIVDMGIQLP